MAVVFRFPGAPVLSPRLLRSIRLANVAQLPVRLLGSGTSQPHRHSGFLTSFCQIIMEFDARGISRSWNCSPVPARCPGPRAGSEILAVWHRHRGSSASLLLPRFSYVRLSHRRRIAFCLDPLLANPTAAFHMRALYPAKRLKMEQLLLRIAPPASIFELSEPPEFLY